nr:unnamed protein product [Callosobruchus analis]
MVFVKRNPLEVIWKDRLCRPANPINPLSYKHYNFTLFVNRKQVSDDHIRQLDSEFGTQYI